MSEGNSTPAQPGAAADALLAELNEAQRASLLRRSHEHCCEEGEYLFRPGAPGSEVYLILDGRVAVQRILPGRDPAPVEQRGPGELVGALAFFTCAPRESEARCLSRSRLAVMSRVDFDALLGSEPELWHRLQQIGLARMRRLQLSKHLDHLFGPFKAMLPHVLRDIESEVSWVSLKRGDTLFRQGEAGSAAYVLLSGSLQMALGGPDGREQLTSTVAVGDTVGEAALLTGHGHRQTVFAARDSELVRLSRRCFELMLQRNSKAIYNVARIVGDRSVSNLGPGQASGRISRRCIGLLAAGDCAGMDVLAAGLATEFARYGATTYLDSVGVGRALGVRDIAHSDDSEATALRLGQWLGEQEANARFLLYRGDPEWTRWNERCVRQTDEVVVVADAGQRPDTGDIAGRLSGPRQRWSLLLLHPPDTDRPRATAEWCREGAPHSVYHLRRGHAGDLARVARILTGNAISLVLSGGAARGFAHLGVLRALEELDIPIDMVGGCSMGATIAAMVAQHSSASRVRERCEQAYRRRIIDYTLPVVALVAGHRISDTIRAQTGDWDIEDFWLPYFCVSSNLTRARTVVHRHGNSWRAIRSSVSVPGLLPPVSAGGDLLVDGGVLNNLPVDVMRELNPSGTVIAVDVAAPSGPVAAVDLEAGVSGWRLMISRLWSDRPSAMPRIASTIMQSVVLGSSLKRQQNLEAGLADVYLNLHVEGIGLLQFNALAAAAGLGYEGALAPLRDWLEANPALRAALASTGTGVQTPASVARPAPAASQSFARRPVPERPAG